MDLRRWSWAVAELVSIKTINGWVGTMPGHRTDVPTVFILFFQQRVTGAQFRRSIVAESRSQKGANPLFRFTCQKFILSKIKRSRIYICKQNKHKTRVPKARVPKTSLSKINIKHVLLRHVPLKKNMSKSSGAPGVNACTC